MSTRVYLVCTAHDPEIRSEGEVGQHLSDLPLIREFIAERAELAGQADELWVAWQRRPAFEFGSISEQFRRHAASFFDAHPHCPVRIVDEYGTGHPLAAEDGDA